MYMYIYEGKSEIERKLMKLTWKNIFLEAAKTIHYFNPTSSQTFIEISKKKMYLRKIKQNKDSGIIYLKKKNF